MRESRKQKYGIHHSLHKGRLFLPALTESFRYIHALQAIHLRVADLSSYFLFNAQINVGSWKLSSVDSPARKKTLYVATLHLLYSVVSHILYTQITEVHALILFF